MDPKDFTTEDWYTVLEGAGAAAGVVAMSDPSGPIGLVKEAMASTEALREDTSQSPFITAFRTHVFGASKQQQDAFMKLAQEKQAEVQTELQGEKLTQEQALQKVLDTLRSAVQFVETKAGAEAAAEYRRLLLQTAQRAAEASKEGGFLGFGGTVVSDAERGMLEQVRTALNL